LAPVARRRIADKRAIITGASSGIGRALALELAREGADVLVVARRADRLEQLASEIQAAGVRGEVVAGDITDPATRRAALQCAAEQFGGLDILINNAGVAATGRFEDASPDRLRQIFDVNVFALIELTREALPLLKSGEDPIVVNMGSIVGHIALPHMSEYSAAKSAIRGFSESLRAEMASSGLDVLLVSPATVETEIWDRMIEETATTSWRARRGATPEYVARKTVRAIQRGQRELLPGASATVFHAGNRFFPGLVAWLMKRRH
jgi:short-subunit dehydrogenase